MDGSPARLLCPWDSPGKNTGVGCHLLLPGNLTDPGNEPGSPALQVDSLLTELEDNALKRCVGFSQGGSALSIHIISCF